MVTFYIPKNLSVCLRLVKTQKISLFKNKTKKFDNSMCQKLKKADLLTY